VADDFLVEVLGSDPRQGQRFFLFATASTQPPTQCVQVVLSSGLKQPGREPNCSPPCSAEVKNTWI